MIALHTTADTRKTTQIYGNFDTGNACKFTGKFFPCTVREDFATREGGEITMENGQAFETLLLVIPTIS